MGGGGAHILGSPMLFVPFTVPTFPATHHQTTHPAHQTHHQQLQPTAQNPVQQPQQLSQLNQLIHLNHQGIAPATTTQPTIHSTSCSPQQQATTPNKVKTNVTLTFLTLRDPTADDRRDSFRPGTNLSEVLSRLVSFREDAARMLDHSMKPNVSRRCYASRLLKQVYSGFRSWPAVEYGEW